MVKRLAKNQIWIWIAIIIAFIGVSLFGTSNQPKQYPPYVSHSPSPTGTKALFTYLDEQDYEVKQWEHDPELLKNEGENHLLMMIEPTFIPSGGELVDYEQFMEKGNTILLFSDQPDLFNINTTYVDLDHLSEAENEGVTFRDQQYQAHTNPMERLVMADEDEELIYDDTGTYAFERGYGDGNLIVVNTAGWLMNGAILEADHAELVLNLIETGGNETQSILFDEFVHEGSHAKTVISAYPFWFLVIIFQGIVLTLVWLLYKGKRFGPIFTPREESVRFSDEGITALASWYIRGKRYQDSLAIQADYVKHLLQDHWGAPYQSKWRDIKPYLERKWENPPKNMDKFINELEAILVEQTISKGQYVQWSKTLDQLRKEVEEG